MSEKVKRVLNKMSGRLTKSQITEAGKIGAEEGEEQTIRMEKREYKMLTLIYGPFLVYFIFLYYLYTKNNTYTTPDLIIFSVMGFINIYLIILLIAILIIGNPLENEKQMFKPFSMITFVTSSESFTGVFKLKYGKIMIISTLCLAIATLSFIIYYIYNKSFIYEDLYGNININLTKDDTPYILDNGLGDILKIYHDINEKDGFTNPEFTNSIKCSDISHYEDCFKGPTENRCNHQTESECNNEKYITVGSPDTPIAVCNWDKDNKICSPNPNIYNRNCTYEVSQNDVCSPLNEEIDFYSIYLKDIPYHPTPQKKLEELSDIKDTLFTLLTSNKGYYKNWEKSTPITDIERKIDNILVSITHVAKELLKDKNGANHPNTDPVSKLPFFIFRIPGYSEIIHIDLEMPGSSDPTSASPTPHGYCSQLKPTYFEVSNVYRCAHTDDEHKNEEEISKLCGIRNSDSNKCMSRYQGIVKEGEYYKVIPSKLCNIDGYNRDGTDERIQKSVFELMKKKNNSKEQKLDGCTDLEILTDMGITMKYGNFDTYTEENTIQNEIIGQIRKDFVIDKKNILTSAIKDGSELLKKEISTDYEVFTGLTDANFYTNYSFPLSNTITDALLWKGSNLSHNTKLVRTDPSMIYDDVVEEEQTGEEDDDQGDTVDPTDPDPTVPDPTMCISVTCPDGMSLIQDASTTEKGRNPRATCCE